MDSNTYNNQLQNIQSNNTRFSSIQHFPILGEDVAKSLDFDRHYLYHQAWAARILAKLCPKKHIDISSKFEFGTIISAFIPFEYYEFRKPNIILDDYSSNDMDIVNLPFQSDSVESISCMHVIEHIGLGRYGDTLDYNGDIKAINELIRVTAKDGNILFVVPVGGTSTICFNAHRIYTYRQIIELFPNCILQEFALIENNGNNGLIRNATEQDVNKETYGCGCFWFKKG